MNVKIKKIIIQVLAYYDKQFENQPLVTHKMQCIKFWGQGGRCGKSLQTFEHAEGCCGPESCPPPARPKTGIFPCSQDPAGGKTSLPPACLQGRGGFLPALLP